MQRIVTFGILAVLGIFVAVMAARPSLATAPSGFSANFTYRATLDRYHYDSNDFKIFQKDQEDVVVRQLTITPGGSSGWHSHPGPVFVLVVQGTLTNYNGDDPTCTGQKLAAGQGFVEPPGNVHIVRNEGTTPVVLQGTFLDVPVGGAFRLEAPRPGNCPF